MREVGSEFWREPKAVNQSWETSANRLYPLSGRTALDCICKDSCIKSVMLPSYCCNSMIEPFLRNGVKVRFYSVGLDDVRYDFTKDCEAVLLIDFFGYVMPEMIEIAKHEHNREKVVIYDGTHLLTGNPFISMFADYTLCSFRKWEYCNFAVLEKRKGSFGVTLNNKRNKEYNKLRDAAAKQKMDYFSKVTTEKSVYLDMFSQAEEMLERDYEGYVGQPVHIDADSIVRQRRINAKMLLNGLSVIPQVQLFRPYICAEDIPMFVPILLDDVETRTQLRKYLTENDIYCPIHWPLSDFHVIDEADKEIYGRELSLICDQRYDAVDMQREINVIKRFFEERSHDYCIYISGK